MRDQFLLSKALKERRKNAPCCILREHEKGDSSSEKKLRKRSEEEGKVRDELMKFLDITSPEAVA